MYRMLAILIEIPLANVRDEGKQSRLGRLLSGAFRAVVLAQVL